MFHTLMGRNLSTHEVQFLGFTVVACACACVNMWYVRHLNTPYKQTDRYNGIFGPTSL